MYTILLSIQVLPLLDFLDIGGKVSSCINQLINQNYYGLILRYILKNNSHNVNQLVYCLC